MKSLKKPVKIFFITLSCIFVLLFVIELLMSMTAVELAAEYRCIRSDEKYEITKRNINFVCAENSADIVSKAAGESFADAEGYTLSYNGRIYEAEDIETETDGDSRLVMITYCTNEASPELTDPLKEHYEVLNILYQHDDVGALYCNDGEMLREYAESYSHRAMDCNRLSLTPIADDLYFFVGTRFE